MPTFLTVVGVLYFKKKPQSIYSFRHYFITQELYAYWSIELCRNLTQSLCDYERKNQQWPFKTASDPHAANKVLLFKVVVNSSYGKLFNKNDPLKIKCFRSVVKSLIKKKTNIHKRTVLLPDQRTRLIVKLTYKNFPFQCEPSSS